MAAPAPLPCYEDSVRAEWVDYNGHMNAGAYAVVFSDAIDGLMDWLGLDAAFRAEHAYTLFTLETHIRYLREAHRGQPIVVDVVLLDDDTKRLHVFEEMRAPGADEPIATCEAMLMGVDQSAGRAAAFPPAIAARVDLLRGQHGADEPPAGAGRSIGIRRR